MAKFYDMLPPNETRRYASLVPAAVLIGVPAVLVILQPDLGTALMICASGAPVMFLAGVPLRLFIGGALAFANAAPRSEEHPSELQSLMRISYAVFRLNNKH